MKKGYLLVLLVCCLGLFSGCIKNTPYVTTIDPSMTATIGSYTFNASYIVPSTLDTQVHDTTTLLAVTGYSADPAYPYDKMIITVTKYKGVIGTYSIVQGQASAVYYHNGSISPALGGVVAITRVTSTSIIGYFSFNTSDGVSVTNGSFNVGLP